MVGSYKRHTAMPDEEADSDVVVWWSVVALEASPA